MVSMFSSYEYYEQGIRQSTQDVSKNGKCAIGHWKILVRHADIGSVVAALTFWIGGLSGSGGQGLLAKLKHLLGGGKEGLFGDIWMW